MGPGLFSPGALNSQAKAQTLGGVTSHAQLAHDCGACHAAPWSSKSMDDRCMACHTDVRTQVQGHSGIHGGMLGAMSSSCKACHSEHLGPNGSLNANFNHNSFPFKLTGKHASVPCQQCHTNAASSQDLRNTPPGLLLLSRQGRQARGSFGQLCGQCHSTTSWANATFDHKIFPVNHGTDQQASTVQDVPPDELQHLHLLRMPPAHAGQRPVRPRGQEPRRVGGLRSLPRRGEGRRRLGALPAQSTSRRAVSTIPAIASAAATGHEDRPAGRR